MISKRVKSKLDQVFLFVYKCEQKRFKKRFKDMKVRYQDSEICLEHKEAKAVNEAEKELREMIMGLALVYVPKGKMIEDLPEFYELRSEHNIEVIQKQELDELLKGYEEKKLERMIIFMKQKMAKKQQLLILDAAGKKMIQEFIENHFGQLREEQEPGRVPERVTGRVPERVSERIPERVFERVPERIPENAQQQRTNEPQQQTKKKYKLKEDKPQAESQKAPEPLVIPSPSIPILPKQVVFNQPEKMLISTETVSNDAFDEEDFHRFLQENPEKLQATTKTRGDLVVIELFGDSNSETQLSSFSKYFRHRSYCFFPKDSLSVAVELMMRLKQTYQMLQIDYFDGYCPYTSSEQQTVLVYKKLVQKIEKDLTYQSEQNCYELSGVCFCGVRNISRAVCEEFKTLLKSLPEVERHEQQAWTITLPDFLRNNRKYSSIEKLVLRQFAECFNTYAKGQAQLLHSEIVSQGIQCTVQVHEPKKKADSLNMLKTMLAEIVVGKFLKFACPAGLTIGELDQVATPLKNEIAFIQDGSTVAAICIDTQHFTNLMNLLEGLKVTERIVVANHLSEILAESVKTYAILGTQVEYHQNSQEFTIVITGYKMKVERVQASLKRLIDSISRNKMQSTSISISQEEYHLLTMGTIEKLQTDFTVKITQGEQPYEEITLTLLNQQCLVLTSLEQSNEDSRDYLNLFVKPDDWAEFLPDLALDNVVDVKLLPARKALYVPGIDQVNDVILADYYSKLKEKFITRVNLLLPEGDPHTAFSQALKVLNKCTTMSTLAIHPREAEDFEELQDQFMKFTKSKEVARQYTPDVQYDDPNKRKWCCVLDNNVKSLYSEQVNAKLNSAVLRGQLTLEFNESDVPPIEATHNYNRSTHQIIHLKSGSVIQLKKISLPAPNVGLLDKLKFWNDADKPKNERLLFDYDLGKNRRLPQSQIDKINQQPNLDQVPIMLGLYTIDLNNCIQTNMYSGFRRKIEFEDQRKEVVYDLSKVDCKHQQLRRVRIEIEATARNTLIKSKQQLLQTLEEMRATEVTLEFEANLMTKAAVMNYCFERSITVAQLSNEHNILKLKARCYKKMDLEMLDMTYKTRKLAANAGNAQLVLPDYWNQHPDEYSVHEVAAGTPEFLRVQQDFKIAHITSLKRIQNRFIWKMYTQEKRHLEEISKKPDLREMMLFHGTRTHPPEKIYEDKEEAFNINFSSDTNMFGRGIYFAKEASYSQNYAYRCSPLSNKQIMLYCRVLVGISQERVFTESCRSTKDTNVRDQQNGIKYESIKSNYHGSDIYIVYKSRRAYPEYVIEYDPRAI